MKVKVQPTPGNDINGGDVLQDVEGGQGAPIHDPPNHPEITELEAASMIQDVLPE